MELSERLERLKEVNNDLEWQLRVAEIAKTSNITISKEQGYLVLALVRAVIEMAEEGKRDG